MSLLDVVVIVLIISWAGGMSLHIAGGFIHLLLAIALVTLIFRLTSGRRL
jgi:hypothetical protein